jgi:hypothetical protein
LVAHAASGRWQVFRRFLKFGDGPTDAVIVNNDEWLSPIKYIDFLRDYGQHFTINRMLNFESVKLRLEREQPLTFLEFNYMILQVRAVVYSSAVERFKLIQRAKEIESGSREGHLHDEADDPDLFAGVRLPRAEPAVQGPAAAGGVRAVVAAVWNCFLRPLTPAPARRSDQWGNIINGVELARKVDSKAVFGLTAPLITKSDGKRKNGSAKDDLDSGL